LKKLRVWNVNIAEKSIANNLETLRYFKSELVFLAEIAHKTNRPELAISYCQQVLKLCQELAIFCLKIVRKFSNKFIIN